MMRRLLPLPCLLMLGGCGLTHPVPADMNVSALPPAHDTSFDRVQHAAKTSFRVSEEEKAQDD